MVDKVRESISQMPLFTKVSEAVSGQDRTDWVTMGLVTIVTLFIWMWAAGETREQRNVSVRLLFTAPEADRWDVQTDQDYVQLLVEGSALALQEATRLTSQPIVLTLGKDNVPNEPGDHRMDVEAVLGRHQAFRNSGLTILRSEPATIAFSLDEIVAVDADVLVRTPGIQTDGEPEVDPAVVKIAMPRRMREQRFPGDLTVEAVINSSRIGRMQPGQEKSREVRVRLPDGMTGSSVRVVPTSVTVTFRIRSSIREHSLETVRVQLAGPSQSLEEYVVQLDPTVLRGVRISADAELIRKLESGEATVVAIVHVKHGDMEQGRESKPISYLMALTLDDTDPLNGTHVSLVEGAPPLPDVGLSIQRRGEATSE
ncbi:MAG: YbbR-like domain-containing protein [Planctomycetota bacterium]|jgi:hypothetical protein